MRVSSELQTGKAGEYLVCADLILKGLIAFPSEQGLPYDVLVDTGKKLLKVQVKTTEGVRTVQQRAKETKCYIFNIKRHGKQNTKRYGMTEIDVFALVCLDTRKIGYLMNEETPDTINIRADHLKGTYYDEKGVIDYQKVVELSKTIKSQSEIARQLNLHVSQVNRMLKKEFKPFLTNARYFSDFDKGKEWFMNL
ncbi:group I intron-associated PD-(D/E)XK endonuclease [Flavobacterium aurantiibacter]|uniref:PD(D/E)XK endonuclease domain-containing protein n=1 Tax=Flavobacterium aurantiibacter TaxID=2023067 RepID=A0A256ABI0_9FLAO|nr:group I intron-associated PD-(D/E)XK endonuclease [Flavobacterium aurantiibacter]OYQ50514.1 hypothetical protein CHX27_00835 [Flavobacterium aurantiibacter]